MEFLRIKYRNSCELGGTVFSTPNNSFWYYMYFPVNVGEGTYELKEEGREDGNGTFIRDFGRLQRDYTFELVVPEYTYDCLCHIMLHDTVRVTTKYDEESSVFNFKVGSPDPQMGGMRKVQISFTTNFVVTSGCCSQDIITYKQCIACDNRIVISDWVDESVIWYGLYTGVPAVYMMGYTLGGELTDNILIDMRSVGAMLQPFWHDYEFMTDPMGICFTKSGVDYFFYLNGTTSRWHNVPQPMWSPYKILRSVTNIGTTIVIKGYCLPNTWVHLQISTDGTTWTNTGAVTDAVIFYQYGIIVPALTPGTLYYFRFNLFDNNCNYGYSSKQSIVKT